MVVIIDKTISVTRLIEWLAVFNAVIHYCKNSEFTVQEFIFITIFTLIAIRGFVWARATKIAFNITWTVIQALK